jgi:hypothetical protein
MTSDLEVPARLVDILRAAGLRATLELRDLNPPAVLVTPRRVDPITRGRRSITVDLIGWAPGAVSSTTLAHLDTMAQTAIDALDTAGIPWQSGEWLARPNPITGDDQLTYTLTVQLTY